MIIIFSGFPLETQQQDVLDFLDPQDLAVVKKTDFITLLNEDLEQVELKVLLTIEPDSIALQVIKKLDQNLFSGIVISARQYQKRLMINDNRSSVQNTSVFADDHRVADRRRKNLYEIIEDS